MDISTHANHKSIIPSDEIIMSTTKRSRLLEIAGMPTIVGAQHTTYRIGEKSSVYFLEHNGAQVYESVCRAYHILEQVKDWLKRGVPLETILELVEFMESG